MRPSVPPPVAPKPSQPALLDSGPAVPPPPAAPKAPTQLDRNMVVVWVALAVGVLTLLGCGYLVLSMSSLRRKIDDVKAAQTSADQRITILEGTVKVVQDDNQSLHSQLDAAAAADPTAIAQRVQPSVYTIATPAGSIGSAWVAKTDGVNSLFVTNYHVIADTWEAGGKQVAVFQDQGAQLTGTITQALPDIDLAVVQVQASIPALKESNETPRAGEAIVVIGSPFGLGGSVTTGAVSALRTENGINFIQFSAPISPGNSGGPLVNALGEVIGITELKAVGFGAEGIAIAIPVNQVCTRLSIC